MSYPTSVLKDSASSLLLLGYSLCLRPTLILLFPHLLPSSSLGASLNHDPHSRVQALVIGCQTSQGYLPEFLSIAPPESLVFVFYCQITILCSLKSTLYLQIALFLITWSPSVLVSPISDIPDEPGSICHPHGFPHPAMVKGYKREKVLRDQIQAMGI